MEKYAAEKIASEYYNLGIELALTNSGMLKTASKAKNALSFLAGAGTGAAGLGGYMMGKDKLLTAINTLLGRTSQAGNMVMQRGPSAAGFGDETAAYLDKLLRNNQPTIVSDVVPMANVAPAMSTPMGGLKSFMGSLTSQPSGATPTFDPMAVSSIISAAKSAPGPYVTPAQAQATVAWMEAPAQAQAIVAVA